MTNEEYFLTISQQSQRSQVQNMWREEDHQTRGSRDTKTIHAYTNNVDSITYAFNLLVSKQDSVTHISSYH